MHGHVSHSHPNPQSGSFGFVQSNSSIVGIQAQHLRRINSFCSVVTPELLVLLESAVHEVLALTASSSSNSEPCLTRKEPAVRNICRVLDALLTKKLKSRGGDYWWAVKEFYSKDQLKKLEREWTPKSSRAYSLSWLYQCLNERTLQWQLLSILQSPAHFERFYHPGAFTLDSAALTLAAEHLEKLENVSFDLSLENSGVKIFGSRRNSNQPIPSSYSLTACGQKVPLAVPSKGQLEELKVCDVKRSSLMFPQALDPKTGDVAIAEPENAVDALMEVEMSQGVCDAPSSRSSEVVVGVQRTSRKPRRKLTKTKSGSITDSTTKGGVENGIEDTITRSTESGIGEELSYSGPYQVSSTPIPPCGAPFCPPLKQIPTDDAVLLDKILHPGKRESPEGKENPEPYVDTNTSDGGESNVVISRDIRKTVSHSPHKQHSPRQRTEKRMEGQEGSVTYNRNIPSHPVPDSMGLYSGGSLPSTFLSRTPNSPQYVCGVDIVDGQLKELKEDR